MKYETNDTKFVVDVHESVKNLKHYILVNYKYLMKIFDTYLYNAFRYTERGTVTLKCKFINETLHISVTDTGIGMDESILNLMYKSFTLYNKKLGTGLGLSICANIIKKYKGTFGVESEKDHGTTFWCSIPLQLSSNNVHDVHDVHEKKEITHKLNILIVDDDSITRTLLKKILESFEYNVFECSDGTECISVVETSNIIFDLIITDQHMEVMNGTECIKILREKDYKMPIILCTGNSDSQEEILMRQIGANEIIVKPVTKQVLFTTINNVIQLNR
jgi:two-component system sensor histidine kinase EvgS